MPSWTKEQLEAIEKSGSNIIVSAGAGSGKTAVLSERVLNKLYNGIHIDELLILTFTRAAAEEMKDRIRSKIKEDPNLKDELDTLDSSYITTFDSFALSVVKKYHYLLNINRDIEITDDTIVQLEKKKILNNIFDNMYINMTPTFENLIKTFSLKNDKTLRSAIESLIDKIDGYIDKENYISYLKNEFFLDENISKITEDFKKYVDEKKKIVSLELQNCYHYFEGEYITALEEIVIPILNTNDLESLATYKHAKLPSVKRGTDDEAKNAKENLKKALDELLNLTEYGNELTIKESILSTKENTLEITNIIEKYFNELQQYKSNNNIYTFGDIANLSIKILTVHESARLELKNKFKEIMIDEYQDTNDVQETFIGLIANNNVYMVGDIKQSIYRFRGSNPSIFKDKYDRYSNYDGGYKIDLIKNFRSRSEVLDNINRVFDLLMDDDLGGAAYTVSHEMVYGNTAYDAEKIEAYNYDFEVLEYHPEDSEFSNKEIEIFTIANDIKNKIESGLQVFDKKTSKLRPFKYSDAVIILDRSKYFDDFKKIFEYLHIPLTILKDDKLNTSVDIYIIKNIIDLIIRIKEHDHGVEFKYSFTSIARSFLYEYSDEEIFDMLSNNTYKESKLYKDFSNIEDFNVKTIQTFIMYILETTDFYNKIYKIGDYENINVRISKILDIAANLGNLGYTIYEFRDYLSDIVENDLDIKYAAFSGGSDSVKILTIHKSKGLEYPVCYFADLDHNFNTRELKEKFISDHTYGLITPISMEGEADTDSVIKTLYKSAFIKEEISEKIRLFYVALTRAREKMILVMPKKDTTKLEKNEVGTIELIRRLTFKSLADFMYGVKDYLQKYFYTVDLTKIGLTKEYLYNKQSTKSLNSNSNSNLIIEEIDIKTEILKSQVFSKKLPELIKQETSKNMNFGTQIHEILEFTDFKDFNPDNIEDTFIKNKIIKFMQNDLLKNVSNSKVFHEYEFIYQKEDIEYHGSIDLMLEYDDHIDIIDYKLKNIKDEHYIKQLKGYKQYIESISNKKVSTYLYSILDETITKLD